MIDQVRVMGTIGKREVRIREVCMIEVRRYTVAALIQGAV
jgi:hypothetical protein